MNKQILINGVLTVASLGLLIGTYSNYNTVTKLKSEADSINERASALTIQSQKSSNVHHSTTDIKGVTITDDRASAYTGNAQTAVLVNALTDALTYNNGDDLKAAYAKYKDTLQGSVWSDLYGKVKSTGEPAINQFAAQIDSAKKTGSVQDSVSLVSIDGGKYSVILTADQGGDSSAGAVNGSNIYEFVATPTDNGFDVKLQQQLVKVDN